MRLSTSGPLTVVAVLLALPAQAQEQPDELQTGFFMLNQYVCPFEHQAEVRELMDELFIPVWRELQEEGAIQTAGFLDHAWGDEWNVNFYMVADDHASFLEAWNELISRVSERNPDWFERLAPLCTMHKDNLYFVRSID